MTAEMNFHTVGREDAPVLVEVETLKDGRTLVYASAERLSQRAFGQMLKTTDHLSGDRLVLRQRGGGCGIRRGGYTGRCRVCRSKSHETTP